MTSLLSSRRRADQLAARLEHGATASLPPDLERLASLASSLARVEAPAARPETVVALRARLVAAAEQPAADVDEALRLPARPDRRRERRFALAAAGLTLVGGSVGVAAAAEQALPGEALYPLKRGLESLQTSLTPASGDRGRVVLGDATDRLSEVGGLLEVSNGVDTPEVAPTLEDFTAQAREGGGLLLASYAETGNPADVVAVRTFTARSLDTLETLRADAPAVARGPFVDAAVALRELDALARRACPSCAPSLPVLGGSSLLLSAAEARRALRAAAGDPPDNTHALRLDPNLLREARRGASSAGATGSGGGNGPATTPTPGPGATLPTVPDVLSVPGVPAAPDLPTVRDSSTPSLPKLPAAPKVTPPATGELPTGNLPTGDLSSALPTNRAQGPSLPAPARRGASKPSAGPGGADLPSLDAPHLP